MNVETLQFADLVTPELIVPDLPAANREEALRMMAEMLVQAEFCEPSFVEAILERERYHPSALPMAGHKIAIPHTDAIHVRRSAILFARLRRPVEFISMGSMDERLDVQMISMFALREKNLIGDLLETLISVYQHDEVLEALLRAEDRNRMYCILHDAVERYGKG